MSDRLVPREVDRMQRAERRWLEQARERLSRPPRPTRSTHPEAGDRADAPLDHEETER